jgi:hypothetical protein
MIYTTCIMNTDRSLKLTAFFRTTLITTLIVTSLTSAQAQPSAGPCGQLSTPGNNVYEKNTERKAMSIILRSPAQKDQLNELNPGVEQILLNQYMEIWKTEKSLQIDTGTVYRRKCSLPFPSVYCFDIRYTV